jgi:elongation factor G
MIRNIALVGHSSTGKTSLSEAMLFTVGSINRLGTISDGTTKSDYTDAEINRQISISTALLNCDWRGVHLNIVDTPGYADFIADARAALWATDCAVIVVDATKGVEVGTDKVWGFAEEYGRPVLLVINHLDKEFADYDSVLASLQDHFGQGVVPFHLPVNPGNGFNQILDIYNQKLLTYPGNQSGKPQTGDVPAHLQEHVQALHERIVEAAAESDDALTEKYLEEGGAFRQGDPHRPQAGNHPATAVSRAGRRRRS